MKARRPIPRRSLRRVFASFTSDDRRFVDMLETELLARTIHLWRYDKAPVHSSTEETIEVEMGSSSAVLVVLSADSVKSPLVRMELGLALEYESAKNRPLLILAALDTAWKSWRWPADVALELNRRPVLDFSAWDEDGHRAFAVQRLHSTLELRYLNSHFAIRGRDGVLCERLDGTRERTSLPRTSPEELLGGE